MKNKNKYILLTFLVIGGALLCFFGFTLAKYVSTSVWDYYLRSRGFYFSSDHLGSSLIKNVDNLWDGGSVYFNIKNNLNQTIITNYDIDYKVSCTIKGEASSYAECRMNGTDSNTIEGVLANFQTCINNTNDEVDVSSFNKTDCELGGYDWVNQVAQKDLYFDVILTDDTYELKDVIVNVTASSTKPYRKTISGNFALRKRNLKEENITINYKNYSNYDRLIISNSYPTSKCVKITWDASKLIIDEDTSKFSSYNTDSNGYINEIIFDIEGKKSISYTFYGSDFNTTYKVTEFQVEEEIDC